MNFIMRGLNGVAGWIGNKHKQLEAMEAPKWLDDACSKIWALLPADLQKTAWALIDQLSVKYGAKYAEKVVAKILAAIGGLVNKDTV